MILDFHCTKTYRCLSNSFDFQPNVGTASSTRSLFKRATQTVRPQPRTHPVVIHTPGSLSKVYCENVASKKEISVKNLVSIQNKDFKEKTPKANFTSRFQAPSSWVKHVYSLPSLFTTGDPTSPPKSEESATEGGQEVKKETKSEFMDKGRFVNNVKPGHRMMKQVVSRKSVPEFGSIQIVRWTNSKDKGWDKNAKDDPSRHVSTIPCGATSFAPPRQPTIQTCQVTLERSQVDCAQRKACDSTTRQYCTTLEKTDRDNIKRGNAIPDSGVSMLIRKKLEHFFENYNYVSGNGTEVGGVLWNLKDASADDVMKSIPRDTHDRLMNRSSNANCHGQDHTSTKNMGHGLCDKYKPKGRILPRAKETKKTICLKHSGVHPPLDLKHWVKFEGKAGNNECCNRIYIPLSEFPKEKIQEFLANGGHLGCPCENGYLSVAHLRYTHKK